MESEKSQDTIVMLVKGKRDRGGYLIFQIWNMFCFYILLTMKENKFKSVFF